MSDDDKVELDEKQQRAIGAAGALIEEAIERLDDAGILSREFALVRTKLEEADMWYDRALDAIGYHYPDEEEEESDDEEDEGNGKKSKGGEEE